MTEQEITEMPEEQLVKDTKELKRDLELIQGVGFSMGEALEILKYFRLCDIASSLGSDGLYTIFDKLDSVADSLEQLTTCVGYVPSRYEQSKGYHILRIAGSIETD